MKICHEWPFKGKNKESEYSDDNEKETEESVNKNEDINAVDNHLDEKKRKKKNLLRKKVKMCRKIKI